MKNYRNHLLGSALLLSLFFLFSGAIPVKEDWGFFGHRRINRLAVFTLPPELIPLYKNQIEYITEHAVDPDKRRYATKHEAVRHYIDIDHWGVFPFAGVPRTWSKALQKYTEFYALTDKGDTLELMNYKKAGWTDSDITWKGRHLKEVTSRDSLIFDEERYGQFFRETVLPQYYEDEWKIEPTLLADLLELNAFPENVKEILAVDRFSEYGILPYHLVKMQQRLTKAFQDKDPQKIIQLSSEFGHYIGDAHVPLHTTENYNGQMTNQIGIHAFWESRIPELFADTEFDYFVGKAEYIEDPQDYYWKIVLKSHSYLDSLLAYEIRLKNEFPPDRQFCYEDRNGQTIRTQCKEYSEAYHKMLGGQVESRMRGSILSVGSAWYTAWVDAGQPDLSDLMNTDAPEAELIEARPNLSDKEREKARGH